MDTPQATRSREAGPLNFHVHLHLHARKLGWNVTRRRKLPLPPRPHHSPAPSASSEEKSISAPPLMQFMKYMLPWVLGLATPKYQGKIDSLLPENPAPLWCSVAASCVYWLIVGAMKQMRTASDRRLETLGSAALASAALSAISLLSVFLPYPVSLVPLTIWIPLPLILVWPHAYALLHRGLISAAVDRMHAIVFWAKVCNSTEEASDLPV